MGRERLCSKLDLAKTTSYLFFFTIDSDCKHHRVSKIILEAYPILATLCDVIDLTNQSFAEKIRVVGCKPSVPVGEASSAVLVSGFHTPVDEERLDQVFLTQLFCS